MESNNYLAMTLSFFLHHNEEEASFLQSVVWSEIADAFYNQEENIQEKNILILPSHYGGGIFVKTTLTIEEIKEKVENKIKELVEELESQHSKEAVNVI